MKRAPVRVLAAYIAATCALFLPQALWPDAAFYTKVLGPRAVSLFASLGQLVPLLVGAGYAAAAARRLETGNRARPAWLLLGIWLFGFAVGETILVFYRQGLQVEPPVPSVGDGFFVLGYGALIVGLVRFVRVYASSGLPLGDPGRLRLTAAGAGLALAALGFLTLAPAARGPHAWDEAIIDLGYPIMDLVVLVPTVMLVRITSRFQGGRVWTVWASILASFLVLAVADTLFAYFDLHKLAFLEPLDNAAFIIGYSLSAFGAAVQHELVRG